MDNERKRFAVAVGALSLIAAFGFSGLASAQGKIVCWKDKSGKTLGCGDKVPPEYQGSATSELSSHGITRGKTESVEEAAARREREQQTARAKAEDDRKRLDQQRQDTALLETYSNEKEIDLKRDREISALDGQIEQFTSALKPATARYNDAKARFDQTEKSKGGAPQAVKDELQRASAEKERLEKNIAAKQKEKDDVRERYAHYRKRYAELKGGSASGAMTTSQKK